MTIDESEIIETVEVATFIDGPNVGQDVEGTFIDGVVYKYDEVEYMCTTTFEGNLVLSENTDIAHRLLVSMLPSFYF